MPQNLSAQLVCPSPKILDFNEKWLHWAFVVRGVKDGNTKTKKKTKQKTKNKNTHSIPIPHCLGMNYYVNFLGGVCSIGFHLK